MDENLKNNHPQSFLLGRGEDLVEQIMYKGGGGEKSHPYTYQVAIERLRTQAEETATSLNSLPVSACPNNEAVAIFELHPSYLSKSWYPEYLTSKMGFRCVGSRSKNAKPKNWIGKKQPSSTVELLLSGRRSDFAELSLALNSPIESINPNLLQDIRRIESIRSFRAGERARGVISATESRILEIVLHASAHMSNAYIMECFNKFFTVTGATPHLELRVHSKGLCFVPVELNGAQVNELEKFSFLRFMRSMPRLRSFPDIALRQTPNERPLISLPSEQAADQNIRAAVFDASLPIEPDLSKWVHYEDLTVGAPQNLQEDEHGLGVTSAVLFGHIADPGNVPIPLTSVDHYRVVSVDDSDDFNLFKVLNRILGVLRQKDYQFINLSLGPDLNIDDDEPHVWTAKIDELLSTGTSLMTVAVGNGGGNDASQGLNRIQVPADCVNAIAVGASSRTSKPSKRAPYSCVGPGRSPGIVKPELVAFGGSDEEAFNVISPEKIPRVRYTAGTSFSAPLALHMATGVSATLGDQISPLSIRALLVHRAVRGDQPIEEIGYGNICSNISDLLYCPKGTATIVYQGKMESGRVFRAPIPLPAQEISGTCRISATLCFSTGIDAQDPPNYTRGGLKVTFRPHDGKFSNEESTYPKSAPFFGSDKQFMSELQLRSDSFKWETIQNASKAKRGSSLSNPCFDIHYIARNYGNTLPRMYTEEINYSLILTIEAGQVPDLISQIVQRYRVLQQLRPRIEIELKAINE